MKKKKEIETLKAQEDNGEIDLYFYDGSGFSLVPNVPYCWQKKGETIQIPSSKSKTLQVLGFLRRDNTFRFYFAHGSVDSVTVVAVFEDFILTLDANKKSVIVIDNAPPHVSAYFEANKVLWEKHNVETCLRQVQRGRQVCNLSTYSPELNVIEILWRFVKYTWLPFNAYFSVETLEEKLTEVLLSVGKKFTISFA